MSLGLAQSTDSQSKTYGRQPKPQDCPLTCNSDKVRGGKTYLHPPKASSNGSGKSSSGIGIMTAIEFENLLANQGVPSTRPGTTL